MLCWQNEQLFYYLYVYFYWSNRYFASNMSIVYSQKNYRLLTIKHQSWHKRLKKSTRLQSKRSVVFYYVVRMIQTASITASSGRGSYWTADKQYDPEAIPNWFMAIPSVHYCYTLGDLVNLPLNLYIFYIIFLQNKCFHQSF